MIGFNENRDELLRRRFMKWKSVSTGWTTRSYNSTNARYLERNTEELKDWKRKEEEEEEDQGVKFLTRVNEDTCRAECFNYD